MATVARSTARHQTTIPAEVRKTLRSGPAIHVEFAVEGIKVMLRTANARVSDDDLFRLVQAHAMRD